MTQAISGYYGKTTTGGTVYYLAHHNGSLKDLGTVAPNKHGQCGDIEVQEFYNGTWNPNTATGCTGLSSGSQIGAIFGLNQADHGIPYRIRTAYIRNTNDTSNLSNNTSWFYLLVET